MRTAVGLGMLAALAAAVPAAAMVPVHVERRAQLRQVIDLPVLNRFGPIDRVELVAPSVWRVFSGTCMVDVRMVPRGRDTGLSPRRMEPQPGRITCARSPR